MKGSGDGWRCEMMRAQNKAGAKAGGKGVETKKEGLHLLLWVLAQDSWPFYAEPLLVCWCFCMQASVSSLSHL